MASAVTDPVLLQQLNSGWQSPGPTPVSDPVVLSQLNTGWEPPSDAKSPASTAGYVGSRFLGSLMEAGKNAASESMYGTGPVGANAQAQVQQLQAQPNQQQTVDQSIYGTTDVPPPNTAARYGGTVASSFGSSPVLSALMPGFTVAGALGNEGGSDLNKWAGDVMPDWLARLVGGVAGGGIYGAGKSLASNVAGSVSGVDKAIEDAQALKQRVQSGEGRFGQFQTSANAAADSVSAAKNPMPSLPGDTKVPLLNTVAALDPSNPLPDKAMQFAQTVLKNRGQLPYSSVQQWQDEFSSDPAIYNALKADRKAALVAANGPDAATAFDQANAASRARYFLDQSKTPQGFYDPLKLTRNLAKDPVTGQLLSDVTPEMAQVSDHAGLLADLASPIVRANEGGPSLLSRALPAAAGLLAEHSGVPGASMLGGMLFEHGPGHSPNPLYMLPKQPILPQIARGLSPIGMSQVGLMGQQQ